MSRIIFCSKMIYLTIINYNKSDTLADTLAQQNSKIQQMEDDLENKGNENTKLKDQLKGAGAL